MSVEVPSKHHSLNISRMKCKLFQFYNYSYQYWMGLHVSQYFNEYMRQKSRDITLLTKVHLVKAMDFPVVMCGCESWTVKKAEHWRIDAFELRCWRRLLQVPWTAWRSNQSILKEISPGYSLERLMLKLQLLYFGHLLRRADSLEKTLMLGKIEERRTRDDRAWDGWMASPT